MKALFKAVVLIGLGGGAQILAHELSGFPTYSPRDTGALLRETGGTAGAQPLPMDMERLGFMEALL